MSGWKTWKKQIEQDWRDAGGPDVDISAMAANVAEFAEAIAECAVAPVAAFVAGLPRALDLGTWMTPSPRAAGEWDDES
jgi:hypothetical protein